MLAMDPQTPRGVRLSALSLTTIASVLAPTGGGVIPLCRSGHTRDGFPDTAGCQAVSVSVDDHRERARSYRGWCYPNGSGDLHQFAVGLEVVVVVAELVADHHQVLGVV